jgi:cytidylate kinase
MMSDDPEPFDARRVPKTGLVVAVDGPSASGKSTVSRTLAERLGLPYVNTGLMYRALTSRALATGTDPDDAPALARIAGELRFDLDGHGTSGGLLIGGSPPGPDLSAPAVEDIVSAVSRHPAVRSVMRAAQRRLGAGGSVVEGRDIGSVVFPDADVKLFVWARPEVRVARRREERRNGTPSGDEGAVAEALTRRDALDARTSPLRPAPGAIVIDTTELSAGEVAAEALRIVERALGRPLGAAPTA